MTIEVRNEEDWKCPKCGDMLNININVGDGHLYDICLGCGFKRKKKVDDGAEAQVQEGV